MKDINEWFAFKCGVKFYTAKECNEHGSWWALGVDNYDYEWDIRRADCREIIREMFVIDTVSGDGDWSCLCVSMDYSGTGKTIAEAELACLQAIYEQESA